MGKRTNATDDENGEMYVFRNDTKPVGFEQKIYNSDPTAVQNRVGFWKYAGIIFSLLAAVCFSFATLNSKLLSQKNYHPLSIAVWRNQGMTVFAPIMAIYLHFVKKQRIFDVLWEDKGKTPLFLVIRGSMGFCGLVLYVYSLKYIKLADATVISFSTPITVTLFARICLGEPCGIVPVIMAFVTLTGVVVLTRPPLLTGAESFDDGVLFGTALAFGTMIFLTLIFVLVRYLRTVHFAVVVMFYGYVASIEGLIVAAYFGFLEMPRSQEDWAIAVFNAVISFVGQCFMTLSLKYEAAGPVALIRTTDIVFGFIVQLVFLGVYPEFISIVGAGIILFGIVVITCRKWLTTLPEKHPSKIKYNFLLK